MHEIFRIVDPAAYESSKKEIECGNKRFSIISAEYIERPFYRTKAGESFEAIEGFPMCCGHHEGVLKTATDYILKFPNCCRNHRKLNGAKWFNKSDYKPLPFKLVETLLHCELILAARIGKADWYKDITDYFYYSVHSFGQLPTGFGNPPGLDFFINSLIDSIKRIKDVPKDKAKALLSYIEANFRGEAEAESDFEFLLQTYNDWLKFFPFDLEPFGHLKGKFFNEIPILKTRPVQNKYLGFAYCHYKSKDELIRLLLDRTREILTKTNALALYRAGKLTRPKDLQISYINKGRELELDELAAKSSADKPQFIQLLKTWLDGEKRYLAELSPLISSNSNENEGTNRNMRTEFDFEHELASLAKEENKFWKGIPMEVVIDHFKVFLRNNRNGQPFLSEKQFIKFIKKGFAGQSELPKSKFNMANGEKGFIVKRFYEFFELAVSSYYDVNRSYRYMKIITDCFDGWTEEAVKSQFRKDRCKESWF